MEIVLLLVAFVFLWIYKNNTSKVLSHIKQKDKGLPFERRNFLLNIPERHFFEKLQVIVPSEYVVFPQVLLSSIIKTSATRKEFWVFHNKINKKTVDFVIFEKQYLRPIVAIEYDGKTHDRKDRQLRDEFVNKALDLAGIKSIHIKHQKEIDFEEVKNKINSSLILNGDKKL